VKGQQSLLAGENPINHQDLQVKEPLFLEKRHILSSQAKTGPE
jgi:hypothetical protein